jgi:hypothetical protein
MRMKKLLLFGVLGVTALALTAQNAFAWGWLKNHCCCGGRCNTTLTIKPYNAFSPVAYGSIVADGCMPVNIYGGQLPCQPSCFNGGASGCCANGMCTVPQGGFAVGVPMQQAQPIYFNPAAQFVVPTTQVPVQYPNMGTVPMVPALPGVQPVGFQQGNPVNQAPVQAPAYWYYNQ